MRRPVALLLLLACVLLVIAPVGADAAKKKKKKPKPFKPREYAGQLVTTTPGQSLTTPLQMRVRQSSCGTTTDGRAKRGICLSTAFDAQYLLACTIDGRPVSSNETSMVLADYRMKKTGTGTITFTDSVRSGPGEAAQTIDKKIVFNVSASKITGTAWFKRTSGPDPGNPQVTVCEGTATFELKLKRRK